MAIYHWSSWYGSFFFFLSFSENKWLLPVIALAGMLIVFYTSFRSFEQRAVIEKLE
ncbi:hypothetical protein KRR40_47475 [Niabella defluvii]|nr:hypothetical protein KRR40_47475 [Niabella sp. I65]